MLRYLFLIFLFMGFIYPQMSNLKMTMWIEGRSSWNSWRLEVNEPKFVADPVFEEGRLVGFKNLELRVSVNQIASSKYNAMTKHTQDAFKTKEYPSIKWTAISTKTLLKNADTSILEAEGILEINGVRRKHRVTFAKLCRDVNYYAIIGSSSLNMKQFNINPPKAFLGSLKVDSIIQVSWKMEFQ